MRLLEAGAALNLDFSAATAADISPDGRRVAVGTESGAAEVIEVATGKRSALVGHTEKILDIAFSGDGTLIATASQDHLVRVWDSHNGGELARLFAHETAVSGVAFSEDLSLLASSDSETIRLWSTEPFRVGADETVRQVHRRFGATLDGLNLSYDWK